MKQYIRAIISIVVALVALTAALTSLALAHNRVSPVTSSQLLPPARPHDPTSGVYTLYDTLTPADVPTATYQWIEIRNTADYAWDLGGDFIEDGDVSPLFSLGFIFPFYNDFYTDFRVSEKGYIFFEKEGVDVGPGDGLPALIPTSHVVSSTDAIDNFAAPFAGDLFGYPGVSRVYIKNDNNPRRTIVEFENVLWCCGQNNPRTFQLILYPSGVIDMQYLKITNFAGNLDETMNQPIRVGLENLDGTAGDVYTQGLFMPDAADFWQDHMTVRYYRTFSGVMALFLPDTEHVWEDPGRPFTVTSNLYLAAADTVTRSFNVLTSSLEVSSTLPLDDWADNITHATFIPSISGTYSSTVQFAITIPVGADFNDVATATFIAESVEPPLISTTFTLIYGPAHRDLQIEKTLDPSIAPALNGAFRYRLTITNTDYNHSDRAAVARGVVVTDILPIGVVYEDCRRPYYYEPCGSEVVTGALGSQTVITWNVGAMDIDEVDTVWLELRNTNAQGTNVINTGWITLTDGIEIGYPYRNSDDETFPVGARAIELTVHKDYPRQFRGHNYIAAGQVIPFDIYYYNNGNENHPGNTPLSATLVDLLPENTTFDRASFGWDYDNPNQLTPVVSGPQSRTLTFDNLDVDNGWWNDAHIRIWVNVPISTPIGARLTNTVTISGENSQATDDEVVEVVANYVDPFVDKGPSIDETTGQIILPEPGKDYTYWITYGNRSVLTDATDFIITDTLPASVTLVYASAGQYLTGPFTSTINGQTLITWYTDTLEAGTMGQVLIIVHVGSDVPRGTLLANQMVVTYSGTFTPATTMDDTDVLTTEVASTIQGSAKQVNNPTPVAGAQVTYTIIVSYSGDTPTVFTVTDSLPPTLTYVTDSASPSTGFTDHGDGNISWVDTINPNSQIELTFRARITETAQQGDEILNTANIAVAGGANINRQAQVRVTGGVFGASSKTATPDIVASGGRVTYQLVVTNTGSGSGVVTVTDSLPLSVTLVGNTTTAFNPPAQRPNVTLSSDQRAFTWTATVGADSALTLSFQVTVATGLTNGVVITNTAYLNASALPVTSLTATIMISSSQATGGIYLPIVFKN